MQIAEGRPVLDVDQHLERAAALGDGLLLCGLHAGNEHQVGFGQFGIARKVFGQARSRGAAQHRAGRVGKHADMARPGGVRGGDLACGGGAAA
ncbi:MAG: hypothetical protein O3B22_17820, partial [Proteobacteria bacterium]|nr:hypothetical protein [Pseudomonadota bacterium]